MRRRLSNAAFLAALTTLCAGADAPQFELPQKLQIELWKAKAEASTAQANLLVAQDTLRSKTEALRELVDQGNAECMKQGAARMIQTASGDLTCGR